MAAPKPVYPAKGGAHAPQYSRGRVSTEGVFAEINTILARHRQKTTSALSPVIQQKITSILPALGVKNIPDEKLKQIVTEVADQTLDHTLEDLKTIEDPAQISVSVYDNLVEALRNHPDLENQIKANDKKILETIAPQAEEIATKNQEVLEKAAVLANIENIAKIQDNGEEVKELIDDSVSQSVETDAPLEDPEQREVLATNLSGYLETYKQELAKQINLTEDNIPTLKNLQTAKENAHTIATKEVEDSPKVTSSKPTKVSYQNLTNNFAQALYLKPRTPPTPIKLPLKSLLVLSSPKRITEAYLSLLSFDQERLARALKEASQKIEKYKNKRALTNKEQRAYKDALKKHERYTSAQAFHIKQPKKATVYRRIFSESFNGRVEIASQRTWIAEKYFLTSMPRIIAHNERLAAGAAFGSLGFHLPGFNFGSLFSKMKGLGATSALGMGMAPVNMINRLRNMVVRAIGLPIGALMLYLMSLGQAAVAGAIVGMGVGAIAGAALPVMFLGPAGILLWPVTIPLGIVMGGTAGALIGLGIASGSATLISMGVGATAGTIIGGILGFGAGAAVGTFLAAACIAATGGLCAPFAPLIVGGSAAIGTSIGAAIGFVIGLAGGYLIGKYIISPTISLAKELASGFTSGVSIGGGLLGGLFNSVIGFISSAVNGFISLGSSLFGGIISGASNLIVGIGGFSVPSTILTAPLLAIGGISAGWIAVGGILVAATDEPQEPITPGENAYFTITKTADKTQIDNSALPTDIKYTITLTAKNLNLTNIQITDDIKVQSKDSTFNVTTDLSGQPISPPCASTIPSDLTANQNWTCELFVRAEITFADSVVSNSITVKATPEGQTEVTDGTVAATIVGTPPPICATFNIQGSWSSAERTNINTVCQTLDRSPTVIALLQNAGTIDLVKGGARSDGVCGTVNGARIITIYCDMSSSPFAKYVIIHELGHVIGNYNNPTYQAFLDSNAFVAEGLMPTYPFGGSPPGESFAEMITEYVSSREYNHPPRSWSGYPGGPWVNPGSGWTTFPLDRPVHYNFAKNQIFGGVEY